MWVDCLTEFALGTQTALEAFPNYFELRSCSGDQLDKIGEWAGIPRSLSLSTAESLLTFDVAGLGWDQASWAGRYAQVTTRVSLTDSEYRAVIRLQIRKNAWDGTYGSVNVFKEYLTDGVESTVHVIDLQNMSVAIDIVGPALTVPVKKAIVEYALIPVPAGVSVSSIAFVE